MQAYLCQIFIILLYNKPYYPTCRGIQNPFLFLISIAFREKQVVEEEERIII